MLKLLTTSFFLAIPLGFCPILAGSAEGAQLHVGAATVSATPDRPVALWGALDTRISQAVESQVTATVLAIESREGDQSLDQAVMVACELVVIPDIATQKVREQVAARLPGFPVEKIFLSATHTHTSPVLIDEMYEIPKENVMQPSEYVDFFVERVAGAVVEAWESRKPGKVGWGMSHAVVAQNRRAVYEDGSAVMYGPTSVPHFRMLEGYEDHTVDVLFFWDMEDKLLATAVNVPCPSQEVEAQWVISADFWHQVRQKIRAEHGESLHILGWCGASGDQSPHLVMGARAEDRMRRLRGLSRLDELARRIVNAWNEAYEGAKQEKFADVPLMHHVETIELPPRIVTEREYESAKAKVNEYSTQKGAATLVWFHGGVVKRYEQHQKDGETKPYPMELHTLRLGDVAIATNSFELFTDFGIQMKARSPALQTFVIQLAGPGSYLPSARAARGGGYSAIPESNLVGPEAGQVLVDRTIERLSAMWAEPAKSP